MTPKTRTIGRNTRCPCGSGKKYKRCCMSEQDRITSAAKGITTLPPKPTRASRSRGPAHRASFPARTDWPVHRLWFGREAAIYLAEGGQIPEHPVAPWVIAQLRELLGRAGGDGRPSIRGVRAMTTDEIVAALAGLGASVTAESFVATAQGIVSAWDLSNRWVEQTNSDADREFLGLAACELWTRWIPARPSVEMLDQRMQEGYDALDAGDAAKAVRIWLCVWSDVLRCLPSEIRVFEDADRWFPALNSLQNWDGDFTLELTNASLDDPSLASEALELFERLVERFEHSSGRENFQRELADYASRAGDPDRAASILRSMIAESPRDAAGYALLSDHWVHQDLPARAVEVLKDAFAVPVDNAAAWGLRERLSSLSSGLGASGGSE